MKNIMREYKGEEWKKPKEKIKRRWVSKNRYKNTKGDMEG